MSLLNIISNTYQRHPLTFRIIIYICLASLLIYRCWLYLDPDFGWHLRQGQLILSQGIPTTDPYSYTMPDYPYIDHEWLTNVLMYWLFNSFGSIGVAVFFGVVGTLALAISLPKKSFVWGLMPLLLGTASLMVFVGHRPQLISWLFLAIIIRMIYSVTYWQKFRSYLPFLFLIWANLHGGFVLGLILVSTFIFYRTIKDRSWLALDGIILVSCLIATFINPYGPRVWYEVYLTMTDRTLGKLIVEWSPMISANQVWWNPSYWIFAGGYILILLTNWRHLPRFQILISCILLIASITSRRHLPLAIIATLPIISFGSQLLYQQVTKLINSSKLRISLVGFLCAILTLISLWQIRPLLYQEMEDFFYPKLATKYLSSVPVDGQILTHYSWGGYVLWHLPKQKVFVDGRMPSWRWEAPTGQSDRAFFDYIRLISGQVDIEPYLKQYQIQTVLWPTHHFDKARGQGQLQGKITSDLNSQEPIINQLKVLGYKVVYQDLVSIILVRKAPL